VTSIDTAVRDGGSSAGLALVFAQLADRLAILSLVSGAAPKNKCPDVSARAPA
jgi:hypothetical protein